MTHFLVFFQAMEHTQTEVEENEDEVEYVVERLETDDELDETQIKDPSEDVTGEVEDEEEEEEDDVGHMQMPSDDDDVKDSIKNIKIERVVSDFLVYIITNVL